MADSVEPTGFNVVTETRTGPLLVNRHDQYVGRSFLEYGEFSPGETRLFRHLLVPGMIVLDIGANIGAHTVEFAAAVGPTGLVLAYEPQRFVYQALTANVALRSLTNVLTFQQAVGAERGTLRVPVLDPNAENNFGGLAIEGHEQGEQVPVIRLDDLTLPRCEFIKIDVEGMEASVLRGGRKFLARTKPVLYLESDRAERRPALYKELVAQGYDCYWHSPPLYDAENFLGNPVNVFTDKAGVWIVSTNWLCLPKAHQIPCDFPKVEIE
jgi:FkbM family methyltransferase